MAPTACSDRTGKWSAGGTCTGANRNAKPATVKSPMAYVTTFTAVRRAVSPGVRPRPLYRR